jgi:hypothetical protein
VAVEDMAAMAAAEEMAEVTKIAMHHLKILKTSLRTKLFGRNTLLNKNE